ncbi:helix-turn-helix transcriptional regulator [Geodermatophilus marinus]|uniref:helix-turn-helix transcriptional regulator n=1 Tax=Geodermatophilus sp. LHW52908 TaxID=2303986 RepID=UPI0018F62191|nr:helix-turn-helix transcriptional regulator [Geodermatophilus sp. LHW52908]
MLAGREAERAAITALLDAAGSSRGGALVIRGVAGSGKSTLLAGAVTSAAHMTVLRTQGVESESPLAFAALQRLLWPLHARLPALPAPQRTALRAALGEAEGDGDRFRAYLGTLSLLADAAEEFPVLAVVDDAHWLDDASAAALLFTARRLQAERVALLFAARDGDVRDFDAGDLPTIVLGGVTGETADVLLAARAGRGIDPAVRDQLVTGTGGNPLALVELAAVLTDDELAGQAPLPAQLPLTGGVERAFLDRYRRLTEAAQRFLLVAAADDTARLPVVGDAANRLDAGDALDEVERAGLLRVEGTTLSLHHPLVRSAVYRAATSAQRRAAHRALADVLAADQDRRAWHLAAAADRPDEAVVTALDAVAERAAGRGGHEAASAAWARAAELTTGTEARGRRLYRAASAAWAGAHPSRAAALATSAAAEVTEPLLRAQLLALQAQIEWNTGSLDDGFDLALQAAQVAADVDPALAGQLAVVAAALAVFGARSPRGVDPGALVPAPAPDAPPRTRAAEALLRGFLAAARRDWSTAAGAIQEAFALTEAEFVRDHLQRNLGIAALVIGDDERGLRLHEQLLTAARRAGALDEVEHALTRGVQFQIAVGAWAPALSAAAEARSLAASTGRPGMTALPTAQLALLAAQRGDQQAAERHLADAATIRQAHPNGVTDIVVVDLLRWARGVQAARQPAAALHHLEQISEPGVRRLAAIDRLEIAVRAGRDDLARAWLEELATFAAGTGAPAADAVVEHGRALLAEGPAAVEHFRRALAAHADALRLPDRARTELALGEHLRRARRRIDAREHLRAAVALFDELGAAPHADRAAAELRASGETARRRDVSTATDLSPQERQVTALVRRGLTTRDVAAQMFLSPRTVEFHLRNVFAKLGVTSRAELTALPLEV